MDCWKQRVWPTGALRERIRVPKTEQSPSDAFGLLRILIYSGVRRRRRSLGVGTELSFQFRHWRQLRSAPTHSNYFVGGHQRPESCFWTFDGPANRWRAAGLWKQLFWTTRTWTLSRTDPSHSLTRCSFSSSSSSGPPSEEESVPAPPNQDPRTDWRSQ